MGTHRINSWHWSRVWKRCWKFLLLEPCEPTGKGQRCPGGQGMAQPWCHCPCTEPCSLPPAPSQLFLTHLWAAASQKDKHSRFGISMAQGSCLLLGLLLRFTISSGSPNFCLEPAQSRVGGDVPASPNTPKLPQNAASLHFPPFPCFLLEVGLVTFTITYGEIFCVLHREKHSRELVKLCPGCCWVCVCWNHCKDK